MQRSSWNSLRIEGWTPDSKRIVWWGRFSGGDVLGYHEQNLDGSGLRPLPADAVVRGPLYSADGRHRLTTRGGQLGLAEEPVSGGAARPILPAASGIQAWMRSSRNARHIRGKAELATKRQPRTLRRGLTAFAATGLLAFCAAGCFGGQSGPHVRGDDVAVVGNVGISKAAYAALLAQAQTALFRQRLGSGLSSTLLTDAVMRRLVSDAEQQDAARRRGTNARAVRAAIERRERGSAAADNASFVGFLGAGPRAARQTRSIIVADHALAERLYVRAQGR